MIMRWRWRPGGAWNLGTSSGQTAMTRLKRATPASAGSCVIASPQAAKQPWRKKKLWYRKCRCNSSECVNCCWRRYWDICDRLHRDWRGAFGDGQALFLTLTYRASSALTPEELAEAGSSRFGEPAGPVATRMGCHAAPFVEQGVHDRRHSALSHFDTLGGQRGISSR